MRIGNRGGRNWNRRIAALQCVFYYRSTAVHCAHTHTSTRNELIPIVTLSCCAAGDVVLKNLKLKQDALKELDLPIQTVYGQLGTLVLKIPWKNLYSLPVVVTIEDLYLLVAPNAAVRFNAGKQAQTELEAKRSALLKLEELRKRELNKDSPTGAADKTFTEKLVAQIINNVQIRITNVHIRYEDRSTSAVPFALGITLGSLEVHTTDADWKETFLSEALSKVFKVAKLDGLAVYMNCNTPMFQSMAVDRYDGMFLQTIARKDEQPADYSYGMLSVRRDNGTAATHAHVPQCSARLMRWPN